MVKSFYDVLVLPFDATPEEIKTAYFEAARRYHPDVNPASDAHDVFLKIQDAFDILSVPEKRTEYDKTIRGDSKYSINISSQIKYSRSALTKLTEPQLIYVMLDLVCNAELDVDLIPPAHMCLVLDRSTSMQGPRMDMIKANIAHLLGNMRKDDTISVVGFSDRAEVIIPQTKMLDLGKLENRIKQIQTGGATEIYQGLEAGIALLRSSTDINSTRFLVLLTDGHSYGDEEQSYLLAAEAAAENITINTMGIGHEWNDKFLDKLASISGGSSIFVSSPKDLFNYLEQKIRSVGYMFARGLKINFTLGPGVEMNYAFKLQPEIGLLQNESPIQLGDLQFGKSISVICEFLVNPREEDLDELVLLDGKIHFELPTMNPQTGRIFLKIKRAIRAELARELPPSAIIDALSKLTLYRMQEKAKKEVEAGDTAKAAKYLQHLATHLLARGDRELAHTVLIEAENIQQSKAFSKDGDKRIKYGTRALLALPGPEQKSL
ncbi:MAG: VWA domain-containing protein [Anaerolineaceae bacterium]|nr:VWA domain-containing protein [Anaerolineaceae bacterium]